MLVSKTRLLPKHVAKLFFLVCTSIFNTPINFHRNWNLGCFSCFCFLFDNVKSSLTCLAIDTQNESSATSCDMFLGNNSSIADKKYVACGLYLECKKLR